MKEQDAKFEACEAERVANEADVHDPTCVSTRARIMSTLLLSILASHGQGVARVAGRSRKTTTYVKLVLNGVTRMLASGSPQAGWEDVGVGAARLSSRRNVWRSDVDSTG